MYPLNKHTLNYHYNYPGPSAIGSDKAQDRWDHPYHKSTAKANSHISVTTVTGARTDDETRPKNIRVVYIMKVF